MSDGTEPSQSSELVPIATPTSGSKTEEQEHSISEAIDRYLERGRDIQFSARALIPAAAQFMQKQYQTASADFDRTEPHLNATDLGNRAHAIKEAEKALRVMRRFKYSNVPEVLESSLYLSLFSAFDVFTGELLRALHKEKPALFERLNRTIPLSVVISASSLEELKESVLDEEIENFRRKSYTEQFEYLELAFGLPLRKFNRWPDFVEAAQRRNLLTHCGGVVSEQYRSVCLKEGYPASKIAEVGEVLKLGPKYFLPTCELMLEVGLKIGQTLWRKVLPDDVKVADSHLLDAIYDALSHELWERAETFGEFAVSQKAVSSDKQKRLFIINYAIALKNLERQEKVTSLLSQHDWSASIPEFRLAEAVLLNRTDDAVAVMIRIGKEGELLKESAYQTWPLFISFRETENFQEAYATIYGYPFVTKLKSTALDERAAQKALEGYVPEPHACESQSNLTEVTSSPA
ncbi:MAG: hypothetical protein Q7T78_15050 [Rhodoferax sp.]|nr:hypothetical protein [Rhodoferax sp.]